MRVDDVAGNNPGRYRSPRYRMPVLSRHEGSKCVSITWRAIPARPCSEGRRERQRGMTGMLAGGGDSGGPQGGDGGSTGWDAAGRALIANVRRQMDQSGRAAAAQVEQSGRAAVAQAEQRGRAAAAMTAAAAEDRYPMGTHTGGAAAVAAAAAAAAAAVAAGDREQYPTSTQSLAASAAAQSGGSAGSGSGQPGGGGAVGVPVDDVVDSAVHELLSGVGNGNGGKAARGENAAVKPGNWVDAMAATGHGVIPLGGDGLRVTTAAGVEAAGSESMVGPGNCTDHDTYHVDSYSPARDSPQYGHFDLYSPSPRGSA